MNQNKVIIIAAYFGSLPYYFPAWLKSCALNPDFDWVLFTDDETRSEKFPPNVRRQLISMADFVAHISRRTGHKLTPSSAYKLCDYKPLYWAVLDMLDRDYEFWGHCDLDMVFGRLSFYVTPELLQRYDKLFSAGHFTLYRNVLRANQMYLRPHPEVSWQEFVLDSKHRGFDEHIGVNKIWALHAPDRCFTSEQVVADIDPHIKQFRLVAPARNYSRQIFAFSSGRILRYYRSFARHGSDEFMYIHFQKRRFKSNQIPQDLSQFYISPFGLTGLNENPNYEQAAKYLNGQDSSPAELAYRLRQAAKFLIRGDLRAPPIRPARVR